MPSEWIMYISVAGIGVLLIAGVTLTFNTINLNTLENTIEVGLTDTASTLANEIKTVLEFGLQELANNADITTEIAINRSIVLPEDISGHDYQIAFKVLPGAKHWIIEAQDTTDTSISEIAFETTIPWKDVSLSNAAGNGLPILVSGNVDHHIDFIKASGSSSYRIYIW